MIRLKEKKKIEKREGNIVERWNLFVTSHRSHPINRILARNVQSLDVEHTHIYIYILFFRDNFAREREKRKGQ